MFRLALPHCSVFFFSSIPISFCCFFFLRSQQMTDYFEPNANVNRIDTNNSNSLRLFSFHCLPIMLEIDLIYLEIERFVSIKRRRRIFQLRSMKTEFHFNWERIRESHRKNALKWNWKKERKLIYWTKWQTKCNRKWNAMNCKHAFVHWLSKNWIVVNAISFIVST